MRPLLLAALLTAQTPTPTGTKDVVVATYYAYQPQAAIALIGSAANSVYLSSWRLTDTGVCAALATAASGSSQAFTYTATASYDNGSQVNLYSGAATAIPQSGAWTITATGASETTYGPLSYSATTTGTPAGNGQFSANTGPSYGAQFNYFDSGGSNQQSTLDAIASDLPATILIAAGKPPVSVYVTWDTSTGTKNPAYAATRGITAAGGTCVMATFAHHVANNFVVADSNYTLTGSYYYRPDAVQIGAYSTAISGTNAATAKETLWNTLTTGGTITAADVRRPEKLAAKRKAIQCRSHSPFSTRSSPHYRPSPLAWRQSTQSHPRRPRRANRRHK